MKKILLLLLAFTLSVSTNVIYSCTNKSTNSVEQTVYICNSPSAYAYHTSKSCSGLSRCNHELLEVSLDDAINKYHRRACKKCN